MSSSARLRTSLRDHHHHHCNHPSFSSTLLEEIYRSFDEERDTHRMKKSCSTYLDRDNRFIVDRWMENEKANLRRTAQSEGKLRRSDHGRPVNCSSSTSSSDSSSGIGGFSSSETESLYGYSSKPKQKPPPPPPLKPIRTAMDPSEFHRKSYANEFQAAKKKKEGNLQRRALKLYGDLKKVKQPISPGGKLSSFLNSLFNSGASKKPKISSSSSPSLSSNGLKMDRESATATTPSTAASRSCLSKTPSSAGRFERRSVRFVDEDRGHVRTLGGDVAKSRSSILASDEEFKVQIREKHRRVEEVAKELLKNYHNRKELTVNIVSDHSRKFDNDVNIRGFNDEEEEEDDDEVSCCSSDLFELENLLEIGVVDRYREELPVYETTHVDTNRAIANGFIL